MLSVPVLECTLPSAFQNLIQDEFLYIVLVEQWQWGGVWVWGKEPAQTDMQLWLMFLI
jgi:hypothetical protein